MWRRLLWWSSDRPAVLPWAILLSLTLLIAGQNVRLAVSESVVRFVYAPFLALRHRIQVGAQAFEKSERLTEELVTLRIEIQRLRAAERENARLRRLLEFVPGWRGRVIPAEVIGSLSPGSGTLWIGAGRKQQIQPNWPVVTEEGLLGRVLTVSEDHSRVRTLWDRLLRVAAYDQRSREGGVIRWAGGTQVLLAYVGRSADVAVGDTILSSGWGGVFPKGLVIGTISAIEISEDGEFLDVTVDPGARPDRLEAVFVIEPLGDDVQATDDAGGTGE